MAPRLGGAILGSNCGWHQSRKQLEATTSTAANATLRQFCPPGKGCCYNPVWIAPESTISTIFIVIITALNSCIRPMLELSKYSPAAQCNVSSNEFLRVNDGWTGRGLNMRVSIVRFEQRVTSRMITTSQGSRKNSRIHDLVNVRSVSTTFNGVTTKFICLPSSFRITYIRVA